MKDGDGDDAGGMVIAETAHLNGCGLEGDNGCLYLPLW